MYYKDQNKSDMPGISNINSSLLYKMLFTNKPVLIHFYCKNLFILKELVDYIRATKLFTNFRYSSNKVVVSNDKFYICFLCPTKNNIRGYKPDLTIVVGDIVNKEVKDIILANSSIGTLLWFKDSKRVLEEFESFYTQDGLDDMLPF